MRLYKPSSKVAANFSTLISLVTIGIYKKYSTALATLKITSELTTPCNTLSGGQLALLQLHRIYLEPRHLILDEPSNHLDSDGRNWLLEKCQLFEGKYCRQSRSNIEVHGGSCHLNGWVTFYKGNYDDYFKQMSSQSEALDKQIAHHQSERNVWSAKLKPIKHSNVSLKVIDSESQAANPRYYWMRWR